jgi:2-octaprenyl-6-methoxyphenol hydroxylase
MTEHCDIAIIGGGPVGAGLAVALQQGDLDVRVLEARAAGLPSHDARALALSYGSRLLLQRLGVWHGLQSISPIRTIHISQRQSFGRAVLQADEMRVPDLGYVLPYPELHNTLDAAMQNGRTRVSYGASVTRLEAEAGQAVIHYGDSDGEHSLHAKLAVVADGGRLLAERFPPETRDYGQSAVIAHVTCSAPLPGTAFERFTQQGPLALLPYQGGYELVWTAPHAEAQQMLSWPDSEFLERLHAHFGDRVGDFLSTGKRSCFPLGLRRAPSLTPLPHTVLIGNAAQTLHPVAGQGFNMGIRDAWELAQTLLDSPAEAIGTSAMLANHAARRQLDRNAGIRFTDSLVRMFSNDLVLLNSGRAASLSLLDCLSPAKHFVAKRMMFGANG